MPDTSGWKRGRQWGGEPIVFDIIPDEKEALKEALQKAAAENDIVVLNYGKLNMRAMLDKRFFCLWT